MKDFNNLCKEFEQLDPLQYAGILAAKSAKIIPALNAISGDKLGGVEILVDFILCSIVVDGKLSEEEFLLMKPMMDVFFGENFDYEDCKAAVRLIKRDTKELKNYLDETVDLLGQLSEDLKDDIIIVYLLICAVDGKVSLKEKNWIKPLIK